MTEAGRLKEDLVERSMMMMMKLPNEMVEEILCRVPSTALRRLRSTCKQWNRLYKTDSRFAREHLDKAAKEFMILMLTKKYTISPISVDLHGDVPSVEVKRELLLPADPLHNTLYQFDVSRFAHCDGLLLCSPLDYLRIVVWNPLTGGTRWVEPGNHYNENSCIAIGYSQDKKSYRKSYKLLTNDLVTKNSSIYDIDSDSWKVVDHHIAPGWSLSLFTRDRVSLKGKVYWLGGNEHGKMTVSLLRFDFATERSQSLLLPFECCGNGTASMSAVREDKLFILIQKNRRSLTEVWVTAKIDETTTAVSWTKVLSLDLDNLYVSRYGSFLLDEEKKVVVCYERRWDRGDDDKSVDKIYIVGEDNIVTTVECGVGMYADGWPIILNYVPSLVQIIGGAQIRAGGKRKRELGD